MQCIPRSGRSIKIRHYASDLPPQWDEDLYKAIASMERHLINERSSEAEQNLHAWLSQLFAISCDDVIKIRHRQMYINISNEIQVAPIEAETRELLSKLKCVNKWLKTEIETLTNTAIEFTRTYPGRSDDCMYDHVCMRFSYRPRKSVMRRLRNPDLVRKLKAVTSTRRRLDNTTTEVSSDSNASYRPVNTGTDTSASANESLVAPQRHTEVIDLEPSPVPNPFIDSQEPMRIGGTTPLTRPAQMSTPNYNAGHRRELKRPIETEETPVSKTYSGVYNKPNIELGRECSASNDHLVPQGHTQPQSVSTCHDHAQMMDNLNRAMGVRLNRRPTQGQSPTAELEQANLASTNQDARAQAMLLLRAAVSTSMTHSQIVSELESQGVCQQVVRKNAHTNYTNKINADRMIKRHLDILSYRERLPTDVPGVRTWVQTNPLYLPYACARFSSYLKDRLQSGLKTRHSDVVNNLHGRLNFQTTNFTPSSLSLNGYKLLRREYRKPIASSLISSLSEILVQHPGPRLNDLLKVIVESMVLLIKTTAPNDRPRRITPSSTAKSTFAKCLSQDFPRAARAILQGDPLENNKRMPAAFAASWKTYFEQPSKADERTVPEPTQVHASLLSPITVEEVTKALPSKKAGKDPLGWNGAAVQKLDKLWLTSVFNSVLFTGTMPDVLLKARTTFIPKVPTPTAWSDYRPTNSPPSWYRRPLGRLMGISENTFVLDEVIRHSKRSFNSLSLAFLDIRKAFDSVNHQSIARALNKAGVPHEITHYLSYVLLHARTEFNDLTEVGFGSGILQGDPISGLIFNLVIDMVLEDMVFQSPFRLNGTELSCLLFADDVVLISSHNNGLQETVNSYIAAAARVGLTPNAAKCASLTIKGLRNQKRFVVDLESTIKVGNTCIPQLKSGDLYKYLGLNFSSDGLLRSSTSKKAVTMLNRLKTAPIASFHKYIILRDHLTSKLTF
ncbi:unnamed protein product [Lepeophtheirus salmonis]|uniref:(salmon louse) hypothetical protein n=1 Tax=Lepeophtheirus salmonis TaxID=72036 RepID=A0A817FE65_LEPSM|nr:unnamed protein product [Lepeophtheirus salmonis]CAG9478506.1 unnamed protein product [Lepeophtheirus salmonis]